MVNYTLKAISIWKAKVASQNGRDEMVRRSSEADEVTGPQLDLPDKAAVGSYTKPVSWESTGDA